MENSFHIPQLAPDVLFLLRGFEITNTLINALIATLIFFVIGLFIRRNMRLRPGIFQNSVEYILELVLPYFDQVTGDRKSTIKFLPLAGTMFFFILLSNWLGLIPGTGSITLGNNFLLRPANTDLNLTASMAIISVIGSHVYGFFAIGFFTHIGKFFQIRTLIKGFAQGPMAIFTALIEFGVGLLEMVSEIAKVLSLSLRLFGNIFAGEVLLSVMVSMVGVAIPAPFILLEILVGLIQASVFAMLTLVYLTVATSQPHASH